MCWQCTGTQPVHDRRGTVVSPRVTVEVRGFLCSLSQVTLANMVQSRAFCCFDRPVCSTGVVPHDAKQETCKDTRKPREESKDSGQVNEENQG